MGSSVRHRLSWSGSVFSRVDGKQVTGRGDAKAPGCRNPTLSGLALGAIPPPGTKRHDRLLYALRGALTTGAAGGWYDTASAATTRRAEPERNSLNFSHVQSWGHTSGKGNVSRLRSRDARAH